MHNQFRLKKNQKHIWETFGGEIYGTAEDSEIDEMETLYPGQYVLIRKLSLGFKGFLSLSCCWRFSLNHFTKKNKDSIIHSRELLLFVSANVNTSIFIKRLIYSLGELNLWKKINMQRSVLRKHVARDKLILIFWHFVG